MTFSVRGDHIRIPLGVGIVAAILLGWGSGKVLGPQHLGAVTPVALLLMLYPMMLEVTARGAARAITRPGLVFAALLLNFLVSPLLIAGILRLLLQGCEESLMVGLTLYGTVPCGGMAPAFTGMLNGNVNFAVAITTICLFLSLGIVPFWTNYLLGTQVAIPPALIFRSLCAMIVIPFLTALLTRWIISSTKGEATFTLIAERFKALASLGLFLLLFAMSVQHGDRIVSHPQLLLRIAAPVSLFLTTLLLLSGLVARVFHSDYREAIALQLSTSAKNNAVAIGLAFSAFGGETALVNAVAGPLVQLPILLGFVALRRWRRR